MSNTKPRKPISHTADAGRVHPSTYIKRDERMVDTEWGPSLLVVYTVGKHVFHHSEYSWEASERITAMLVEAGVVDVMSFNEIAGRTNAQGLIAALTKAGKSSEFLSLVLRTPEGTVAPPSFFAGFPGWVMEPFRDLVCADFFTTNPSALSGLRALSMPELALKTARAALTQTGTSSTQLATATSAASQ